jgi:hypothetical protein
MRGRNLLASVIVLALCVGSGISCVFNFDLTSCDDYPMPGCPGVATLDGGHDGGKPDCSGDPSTKNVTNDCGVFAQADAPAGGDGTQAKPFVKLADAVATAESAGKRVYACTNKAFAEAVTIGNGIEVYGGLDCTKGWTWSQDARAQLSGPADKVALTVTSAASGAKVEGFAITGASPSDLTMGGSSIAVAVDDVAATLDHCDVKASDAADGVAGTTSTTLVTIGADAPMPTAAAENACTNPLSVVGGPPGVTMCGGVDTSGGAGGKGGITGMMSGNGQNGAKGANPATPPPMGMDGLGGAGQTDPAGTCMPGDPGAPGGAGAAGNGGSAMGDALTLVGITNGDDTGGKPGTPGQGGGGGGGAKSGAFCTGGVDGNGASGGGAGAGGCGGLGGGGGKAGGSSIAIVSLGAKFVLTEVTLAVSKGGKGGDGATNQTGGKGGNGASGGANSGVGMSIDGCKGGDGGKGGAGGPGGGGRGGHAIGIAYAKTPMPMAAIQMFTPGTAGSGGTVGNGAPASSNGASGSQGQCWDFSTSAACK